MPGRGTGRRHLTKLSDKHLNGKYKFWVRVSTLGENYFRCRLCNVDNELGSMGNTALSSHAGGIGHKNREVAAKSAPSVFVPKRSQSNIDADTSEATNQPSQTPDAATNLASESSSTSSVPRASNANTTITSFFTSGKDSDGVISAEIMWTVYSVVQNNSFASNSDISYVFSKMFDDSQKAQVFKLAETKTKYTLEHGLQVHFQKLLTDKVQKNTVSKWFVILYDETLNQHLQEKQLDMHIRFWDHDKVLTRYISSEFLGKSRAVDITKCFESLERIQSLENMVQISMDGPNVNLKAQDDMNARSRLVYKHDLLNMGSCGLHQVHNALKAAMDPKGTDDDHFKMQEFLRSLFKLFNDATARREEYTRKTGSSEFPQSFAPHRWAENKRAAKRAIKMLPHLKTFCKAVDDHKRSGLTKITSYSYGVVRDFVADKLAKVKLLFFIDLCDTIEPFLVTFQTDKPMAPFVVSEIFNIVRDISRRFLRNSHCKLHDANPLNADFRNEEQYLDCKRIDIGWQAKKALEALLEAKDINVSDEVAVKVECRSSMVRFCEQLKFNSPAKHILAVNIDCLSPELIVKDSKLAHDHFGIVLGCLKDANLEADNLDKAGVQFKTFAKKHKGEPAFKKFRFNDSDHRLDTLLYNALYGDKEYMHLWSVVRLLLVLSHGQASVERGFSINKYASTANQHEESLVARRVVRDHINYVGGIREFEVTPDLIKECKNASRRYKAHLEAKKREKELQQKETQKDCIQKQIEAKKNGIKSTKSLIAQYEEQKQSQLSLASEKGTVTVDYQKAFKYICDIEMNIQRAKTELAKLKEEQHDLEKLYKNA